MILEFLESSGWTGNGLKFYCNQAEAVLLMLGEVKELVSRAHRPPISGGSNCWIKESTD